jgi:hypothetical protein
MRSTLQPHPLLRPADQPNTCQQDRPHPRLARGAAQVKRGAAIGSRRSR